MLDSSTALVGRLIIDLPSSTVSACFAASNILGEVFLESIVRIVSQPRRGIRDVRPAVSSAISARVCNHLVLRRSDGILRQPVVMTVEPPNGQSPLIVCHVVDHSRSHELSASDEAMLAELLADSGIAGAARQVGAFAERYGVDDYTASMILRYNAQMSVAERRI